MRKDCSADRKNVVVPTARLAVKKNIKPSTRIDRKRDAVEDSEKYREGGGGGQNKIAAGTLTGLSFL